MHMNFQIPTTHSVSELLGELFGLLPTEEVAGHAEAFADTDGSGVGVAGERFSVDSGEGQGWSCGKQSAPSAADLGEGPGGPMAGMLGGHAALERRPSGLGALALELVDWNGDAFWSSEHTSLFEGR